MPSIRYYPRLQNHNGVFRGYTELSPQQKNEILPIFAIEQRKSGGRFEKSIEQISEVVGNNSFIFDIGDFAAPQAYVSPEASDEQQAKVNALQVKQDRFNLKRSSLFDSTDGHANWREVVSVFPNCIPCLQYSDLVSETNPVIRQASRLLRNGYNTLAIKIDVSVSLDPRSFAIIGNLIAMLDKPSNLIIILNAGVGRQSVPAKVSNANSVIQYVENSVEVSDRASLRFVFFGESFTKPAKKGLFEYDDKYWEVLEELNCVSEMGQGDYATYPPFPKRTTYIPDTWIASCVYPLEGTWLVFRDKNAKSRAGWADGCNLIVNHDDFEIVENSWGAKVVQDVNEGNKVNVKSSADWYAVRVNLHVVNQINAFTSSF